VFGGLRYDRRIVALGLIIPPDQPPERFVPAAVAAEGAGLEEVWLWEDCFAESGIGPAAAVLGATSRVRVGIGLLPVPLRNVALCAMEIAAVSRLFPDRLVPGIGHGVVHWMDQVGAKVASPLTLLGEYATALRSLLAGDEVTTAGRYVSLDAVQLRWPPASPPPLLIGAVGPKTIAVAGATSDGVIFTGDTGPDAVTAGVRIAQQARSQAGRAGRPEIVSFLGVPLDEPDDRLGEQVAALAAAGADRVAVFAVSASGAPDGSEGIIDFAGRLGALSR
jgi:alkanesulfonate monooxygenase SsuD/methylene tetrahydromethanopterin reductase-like flavin-dependent oxidoreductase (luciferase family)